MKVIRDKVRVLVAEDNPLVSEIIKRSLCDIGFELVGLAVNGIEAVKMALVLKPDVVLMDIAMPGLDGLEACQEIQRKDSIPVVVISAFDDDELLDKAGEAGVSVYLTKPTKTREIERAVVMAMARHGDLMECWRLNRELSRALEEIKTLRGILPLCTFCKKIRNDEGYWEQVDVYIKTHSNAEISHSICPDCLEIHYSDLS